MYLYLLACILARYQTLMLSNTKPVFWPDTKLTQPVFWPVTRLTQPVFWPVLDLLTYPALFPVGVVGNLLVLTIIIRQPDMRTARSAMSSQCYQDSCYYSYHCQNHCQDPFCIICIVISVVRILVILCQNSYHHRQDIHHHIGHHHPWLHCYLQERVHRQPGRVRPLPMHGHHASHTGRGNISHPL